MGIFVTPDVASRSFQKGKHVDHIHAELAITVAKLASRSLERDGIQLNVVVHPLVGVEQVLIHFSRLSEN